MAVEDALELFDALMPNSGRGLARRLFEVGEATAREDAGFGTVGDDDIGQTRQMPRFRRDHYSAFTSG